LLVLGKAIVYDLLGTCLKVWGRLGLDLRLNLTDDIPRQASRK